MGLDYDAWLEKPYQDQCDWEDKIEREINDYRSEPEFLEDARKWAIKKGLNLDEVEFLEDDYLESSECYDYCEDRLNNRGGDY